MTRQIAETDNATGLQENEKASKKGGNIAKGGKLKLKEQTGRKVITGDNFLTPINEIKIITFIRYKLNKE